MKNILLVAALSFITQFGHSQTLDVNSHAFAVDLYLASEDLPNRCFSPYSIFRCLGLVSVGAQNTTKRQIEDALHLSSTDIPSALYEVHTKVEQLPLKMTDVFWVQTGLHLTSAYEQTVKKLGSTIQEVDCRSPVQTAQQINTWISAATNGGIPGLLSPADISPSTHLLLTNTIYFEGLWAFPFLEERTKSTDFYGKDAIQIASMMHQTRSFPYYENELRQMLLLPIAHCSAYCFFLLPKQTVEEVEASLSHFFEWMNQTNNVLVDVQLPKFQVRQKMEVHPILQKLGIREAFSSGADFSLMVPNIHFHLDQVLHEAFFSIEEKGIRAGAATAVTMATSCAHRQQNPISFVADHPFLFGVVDENSQLVLFLGKLSNL